MLKYVTEAFSLYSGIVPEPCLGAGYAINTTSTLFKCRVCSSILLILNMHSSIHSDPCYMHACSSEDPVLHSCAFIIILKHIYLLTFENIVSGIVALRKTSANIMAYIKNIIV